MSCRCSDEDAKPPGRCRIYVAKNRVARNRSGQLPSKLPVIVVEHGTDTFYASKVVCNSPVTFQQTKDDTKSPYVWAETDWPVDITHL